MAAFIHEVARVLPEARRDDYLAVLNECAGETDEDKGRIILKDDGQEEITAEVLSGDG